MNDEDLYSRRFMPIISNHSKKNEKGIYDHEKVIKLWMYLVDDAAKDTYKNLAHRPRC